jgi:prolyl oligopeptidase PreP (S9A serine peptidase family)
MDKRNQQPHQLIPFAENLLARMNQHLDEIRTNSSEEILYLRTATKRVRSILIELYTHVSNTTFKDLAEEVLFFRDIKPKFLTQQIYLQKLLELKLNEPFSEPKKIEYYQTHLVAMQEFRNHNSMFYDYCLSGDSHFDTQYFTRRAVFTDLELDKRIATGFDIRYATLLANDRVCMHITNKYGTPNNTNEVSTLTWTAPKSALIELTYALKASDVFNNGNADLKQIATTLEKLFHIKLGNYYRVYQDIRLRKSGQTNFLDVLKDKFISRASEKD